ncbi:MAG: hypothetical protein ACI8RZ_000189 [Myxococcota bacterium]|jgi:hypothetical protein
MSSTAWRYFVPYQPDYQAALDALRAKTFTQGAYLQPWTERGLPPVPPPQTIDEALQRCGPEGSHSILDIVAFSLIPGPGLACLVPPGEQMRIYGTTTPTHEDISDHRFALVHTLDFGHARILTVYDEEQQPVRLYLEGLTGAEEL